jgi:arabinofuranan 3-O-arabinosyltransferase
MAADPVRRGSRPTPLLLLAVAVGIAASAVVSLHVQSPGDDLTPWLQAARDLVAGAPLYDDERFLYPPGAAVLGVPFILLGDFEARLAVRLVLAAAVVVGTLVAARVFGHEPATWPAAVALLVVVCSPPFHWGLLLGNVGLVMLLALALTLLLLLRGSPAAAGVVLGLSLALKPMLAPVLLVLLLDRRWRALAAAGVVAGGVTLVGLAWSVDGPSFVTTTVPFLLGGQDEVTGQSNASILGVALQYGLRGPFVAAARVIVLAAAVAAAWWLLRARHDLPSALTDASTVALLGAFLGLSVAFDHYALLLVPLAVAAALGRSRAMGVLLWPALAIVMLSFPLPGVLDRFWTPSEYMLIVFALCLAALVSGAWRRRADTSGEPARDVGQPAASLEPGSAPES